MFVLAPVNLKQNVHSLLIKLERLLFTCVEMHRNMPVRFLDLDDTKLQHVSLCGVQVQEKEALSSEPMSF